MNTSLSAMRTPPGTLGQGNNFPDLPDERDLCITCLYGTPPEGVAFGAAALVSKIVFPAFAPPLAGISLGLFGTRLVLNTCDKYTGKTLIKVKVEACKLNRKYANLQKISFFVSLALGLASSPLGLAAGIFTGSFGAIILEVEHYILLQKVKPK